MTHPRFSDHRNHVASILDAARRAVDPETCTRRALQATSPVPWWCATIAVGKAAAAMRSGLGDAVAVWPNVDVVPSGTTDRSLPMSHRCEADHPLPTLRNAIAAGAVHDLVRDCVRANLHGSESPGSDWPDSIILLLSGGASALLTLPVPQLGMDDIAAATRALLRSGATIHELNCVRKHIDELKGGRLAALAHPLPVHAYILSDVIGDDPSVIGSGPVSPDPTTFADAVAVIDKYELWHDAPAVTSYLRAGARGEHPETPKPGDPIFDAVRTHIIANNATALHAARDAAQSLGFTVLACEGNIQGEAREVGALLARRAVEAARSVPHGPCPAALLLGGETTVTVRGRGVGGRNQELALAAAIALDGHPNIALATFSTDGVDGPTDAAGAIITGRTCAEARSRALDPHAALDANDSHTLLAALNALIRTGPTGTNVNDLALALIY